jgi:hypothetical protein
MSPSVAPVGPMIIRTEDEGKDSTVIMELVEALE